MAPAQDRQGDRTADQQDRSGGDASERQTPTRTISGPGAADFLTAPGGLDRPESGDKGMGRTRAGGLGDEPGTMTPRPGPDDEAHPGERRPDEAVPGSATGTVGGGGAGAHNPSPIRATRPDDTAGETGE